MLVQRQMQNAISLSLSSRLMFMAAWYTVPEDLGNVISAWITAYVRVDLKIADYISVVHSLFPRESAVCILGNLGLRTASLFGKNDSLEKIAT